MKKATWEIMRKLNYGNDFISYYIFFFVIGTLNFENLVLERLYCDSPNSLVQVLVSGYIMCNQVKEHSHGYIYSADSCML